MDSNHRSETQQIYSLPPLATREPPRVNFKKIGAGDGTRTRNLLITNQLLCQLSYTSPKLFCTVTFVTSKNYINTKIMACQHFFLIFLIFFYQCKYIGCFLNIF